MATQQTETVRTITFEGTLTVREEVRPAAPASSPRPKPPRRQRIGFRHNPAQYRLMLERPAPHA